MTTAWGLNMDIPLDESKVLSILNAESLSLVDRTSVIRRASASSNWETVYSVLSKVLSDHSIHDYAEMLLPIFWDASLAGMDFDYGRIAALFLSCGIKNGSKEYNLLVSICSTMKSVEYQEYSFDR